MMKNFEHSFLEKNNLIQHTTDKGRWYELPSGEFYPSVTTVLKKYHENDRIIEEWITGVGVDKANQISTQAKRRGTAVHKIVESFLHNDKNFAAGSMPANLVTFNKLKPELQENVDVIYGIEHFLYSSRLRSAGSADLICTWKGKPVILDIKTSKRIKKEEWIEDYFIQTTAYALMANELYGLNIKDVVVLIANDEEVKPQCFEKKVESFEEHVLDIFQNTPVEMEIATT